MDTSGFYKYDKENDSWLFAPNFVWSKNYTLEREGNRESVDDWQWHDEAPADYLFWENQSTNDPTNI